MGEMGEVTSYAGASEWGGGGGKKTLGDLETESENLITEELTFV